MKGVFGKIFLAFCGSICAGAFLSALVLGWLFPRKNWLEGWWEATRHTVRLVGITGLSIYEDRGSDALARFLEQLENDRSVRYFFLDSSGRELLGRSLPKDLPWNPSSGPSLPLGARRPQLLPSPVEIVGLTGPSGAHYTLVRHVMAPMPPLPRSRLVPQAVTLGGLLSAASVLCFFLARNFVAPLRALQHSARLLAAGDFGARVKSEVRHRKDEFGVLARDFDHMAEQLGRLVEAQRQLLRDISHELRSPLTRLGVAVELTRKHAPAELSPFLDRIEKESERLNTLISHVLTLARLEHVGPLVAEDRVSFHRLVEEVARDADFEAQGKGCAVRWSLEPADVVGSADLLRSAVENVIRNAVTYSPAGTVVTVSMERRTSEQGQRIVLRVEDEGPGVPDSHLPEIFRPFYRVAKDRNRKTGGSGLGLAIAFKAVQRHGGSMTAANRPEGGLCVTVELPIAPS
uniref:histidine kinase n=1 Tax=Desulfacinum infernum TaxID=35837 RepID=A0A832A326_9BACT